MEPGAILGGRYEVVGTLGQGAMGVVYDAVHRAIGRHVALKMLREDLGGNEEVVQRFQMEARAAGSLGHPNIVQILDAGRVDGGPHYLVMEKIDGGSLADVIAAGPIEVARVIDLGAQVLAGLGAAHRRGIVHRDLKPENVLITRDEDGREVAKVGDFGISKVLDPQRLGAGKSVAVRATESGTLLGTPLYMSPEQARGLTDVDARTDLWAVGCVLYEMLCGRPPFVGESYVEILTALMTEPVVSPGLFRGDVPPAVEAVVMSALAKDRGERPADAAAMRAALLAAASNPKPDPKPSPTPKPNPKPDDAAMIDALSRAVAAEVEAGNTFEYSAASADPEPEPISITPTSTISSTSTSTPASDDAFAPPENAEAIRALDIDHATVARSTAPRAAERISMARASVAVVADDRGGGAGKWIVVLLLLAIIGAGGFAAYRKVTLGYVLAPPGAGEPVPLSLAMTPENAVVRIDGEPAGERAAFPAGEHELIASAPGRLSVRHRFAIGGDKAHVALRLPSALAPLLVEAAVPFTFTPAAAATGTAALPQVDDVLAKLAPVHDCLARIAAPVTTARGAYATVLRGKDADRDVPTIPASEVEQCRSLIERAVAAPPAIPQLDEALLAYGRELAGLESQARAMATYYRDGKHRSDHGAFGKKNERPLAGAYLAADTRGAALEALVVAIAEAWQLRELDVLSRLEGNTAHVLARRAALAAHGLALAALAGDDRRRAEARARLDEAAAAAREA
ncbi:MAG TPA: protein kinase, partial [Kofleriaceae bacterium]|nr:protein kinase [Kofleriaceae bacterium]